MAGELASVQEKGRIVLSQQELNLYVARRAEALSGVDAARIELGRGHIRAWMRVAPGALVPDDFELLRSLLDQASAREVYCETGLGTSSGRIQLTFRRASTGRIPLPQSLVESLLGSWLGCAEPVRLTQAVPLWPGVEELRVDPVGITIRLTDPGPDPAPGAAKQPREGSP